MKITCHLLRVGRIYMKLFGKYFAFFLCVSLENREFVSCISIDIVRYMIFLYIPDSIMNQNQSTKGSHYKRTEI